MTLLATYVQFSDLHIGEVDPVSGNSKTEPSLRKLACTYEIYQGSLGHQARSLRLLDAYLKGLKAKNESFEILVTGDYTRCGRQDELDNAHEYLTNEIDLHPPNQSMSGLRANNLPLGVPGNHDQWGGDNNVTSVLSSLFPGSNLQQSAGFPYIQLGANLNGRQLIFVGIDSDADVKPGSLLRILAHGEFLSQIKLLHSQLGPKPTNDIRVLIIHHTRHPSGKLLRMTPASRAALEKLLKQCEIEVVLSGHTHSTDTKLLTCAHELCSGSSAQIDTAPAGWTNIYNRSPTVPFKKNGFLTHRLYEEFGKIRWDAHAFLRGSTGQFRQVFKYSFHL